MMGMNNKDKLGEKIRVVLFDPPADWRRETVAAKFTWCTTPEETLQAARGAKRTTRWLAPRATSIDRLIKTVGDMAAKTGREKCLGDLLVLGRVRHESLPALGAFFASVVGALESFEALPRDQLAEVLALPRNEARDLFVGGFEDSKTRTVTLARGDLSALVVPFSIFRPSGTAKPDFSRLRLDDYGQAIRFGEYEASTDFVLYALDSDYRRRSNARRIRCEAGFGPSLRRLRMLRKIGRDAFDGVSPKTIARIELGDVQKPHGRTLRVICETLGVDENEIETY